MLRAWRAVTKKTDKREAESTKHGAQSMSTKHEAQSMSMKQRQKNWALANMYFVIYTVYIPYFDLLLSQIRQIRIWIYIF
jgi:hypothetical protein